MFCHGGPPQRLPLRPSFLHRLPFRSVPLPPPARLRRVPFSRATTDLEAGLGFTVIADRFGCPWGRSAAQPQNAPTTACAHPSRGCHGMSCFVMEARRSASLSVRHCCIACPSVPARCRRRPARRRVPFPRVTTSLEAGPGFTVIADRPGCPWGRGGTAKRPGRRPSPAPSRGRHGGPPQRLPLRPSLLHRLPFRSNPLLVPARPRRVPFPRVTTGLEAGPGFTVIADRTGCPWGRSAAEPQSAPAAVPPPPPRGDVMEARRSAAPLRPSFLHRLPFRSSPLPPPARLAARPLFARIARACAPAPVRAFRAGAVRAPDCAHARSRQSAHVSPAFHRGFFRAGAAAGGEAVRADPLPSSRPHLTSDFPESSRPR